MKRTLFEKRAEHTFHFRLILRREDVPLMIRHDAAVPKSLQIFIPELPVWQTMDERETGMSTNLVQKLPAGFAAAGIDQEESPFTVQCQRQDERNHGARFVNVTNGFPGDPLPSDLEVTIVNLYGRPSCQADEHQRNQCEEEGEAKSGNPEAGEKQTGDRDSRTSNC